MITGMGFILSFIAFVALIVLAFKFIFFGVPFPGFGSIICLLLLLFGFLFITLGIMSEYLGMIFTEVKARPSFIVESEIGLTK
jgi:dolichol-phosphate mannosyltransferase